VPGGNPAKEMATTMDEPATGHRDHVHIMVVDDNADNRLTLQSILAEPGRHVVTAASGRDALRRLLGEEFAVILLDVNMPIMDGFETAALVRQRKSSERTPIIFITAFADETHVSRGYSLGAVDYIVSPVVPEVLRSKVAVFVDLFRKTEQVRRQAESLRRRADQLYQLTEASLAINSAASLDEILQIVTETALDLCAARRALTVANLDLPTMGDARPVAFAGDVAAHEDGEDPAAAPFPSRRQLLLSQAALVTASIADRSRAVVVPAREVSESLRWQPLREGESGAEASGWLAAPLTGREGGCIGWVHLTGRAEGEFGDDDRTNLTQLVQIASIAIENMLSMEAREANRLKDEFLTTLSHELRTPLTAILGWTRLLRTGPFDAQRTAHGLEVIERNVTVQAKLIEDLLDVSGIIAGKLRISLRPVALLPPVEAAVEGMLPAAAGKGVALELAIDPQVDARSALSGDGDRLQQVAWNLLSNAIKFTPPGGRIEVAVSREGEWFKVTVRDNGKGISPQFLRHVFDRFRQDDSGSTRTHGGLGIGLAIVQHIVELHGGRVEAESPGLHMGAVFTVTLPALPAGTALAEPAVRAAVAGGVAGDAARHERIQVLVVDDEPDTREILCEILRGAGAEVLTAASPADALAVCERTRPDVLISDIAMPGGDGYSLIRQLRRRGPEGGGDMPAIAVSAHAREDDRRRAMEAGFERYLTKPVEPADLIATLREIAPAWRAAPAGSTTPGAGAAAGPGRGQPQGGAAGRTGGAGGTAGRRILLVEDDDDSREALKTLLEMSGHRVEVVADGSAAVAEALASLPEVALVDIGLPDIDGHEVARRIRAEAGGGGIFLVALTGYGGQEAVAAALAAGFDAHFTKPVELARLERLLRENAPAPGAGRLASGAPEAPGDRAADSAAAGLPGPGLPAGLSGAGIVPARPPAS
jgi:CheY-like chemotaxis protein/nitrogen-specific signal transduction histidine kinase